MSMNFSKTLPDWSNLHFLIADDDYYSCFYLEKLITRTGGKTICTTNGVEAVTACLKNPSVSVVLIDLIMPVLDGYETLRLIRKYKPETILIAQTAFGFRSEEQKCNKAGFDGYLSKPILPGSFYKTISKTIMNKSNHLRIIQR